MTKDETGTRYLIYHEDGGYLKNVSPSEYPYSYDISEAIRFVDYEDACVTSNNLNKDRDGKFIVLGYEINYKLFE